MEKPPLEKIIGMLERIDIRGWESNQYLDCDNYYYSNKGYPVLSTNLNGLSFHIIKYEKFRKHYRLEVSDAKKNLRLFSYDKKRKLLKNFYEKTFEKLKSVRQEESEKNIEGLKEKLDEVL